MYVKEWKRKINSKFILRWEMEVIQEDRSGGKQQLFEKCLFSQHKGRHENEKNAEYFLYARFRQNSLFFMIISIKDFFTFSIIQTVMHDHFENFFSRKVKKNHFLHKKSCFLYDFIHMKSHSRHYLEMDKMPLTLIYSAKSSSNSASRGCFGILRTSRF